MAMNFFNKEVTLQSVVLANQKGGVGKTTSALNVAWLLSERHRARVLFVDLDPQASATVSVLGAARSLEAFRRSKTTRDVLIGETTLSEAVIHKAGGGPEALVPFDFVPSHISLSEFDASREIGAEFALQEALGTVKGEYDWVVMDAPPNLGLLTTVALVAANLVVIPVRTEPLDAMGVMLMVDTVGKVQRRLNQKLRLIGILPTQWSARKTVDQSVLDSLTAVFGAEMILQAVPNSASYGRAAQSGEIAASLFPGKDAVVPYELLAEKLFNTYGRVGGAQ